MPAHHTTKENQGLVPKSSRPKPRPLKDKVQSQASKQPSDSPNGSNTIAAANLPPRSRPRRPPSTHMDLDLIPSQSPLQRRASNMVVDQPEPQQLHSNVQEHVNGNMDVVFTDVQHQGQGGYMDVDIFDPRSCPQGHIGNMDLDPPVDTLGTSTAQHGQFPDRYSVPIQPPRYFNSLELPPVQYPHLHPTPANMQVGQGLYMPATPGPGTMLKNDGWPQRPGTPLPTGPLAGMAATNSGSYVTREQYHALQADMLAREDALRAKLLAAEEAAEAMKPPSIPKTSNPILAIKKPKGEAGDSKRGFNLRSAMGLQADGFLYNDMLRAVRRNVERVRLDFDKPYRLQDHELLASVFKLGRKQFPYLTRERFPHDWAQAEMLKQYLKNSRRSDAKRARRRKANLGASSVASTSKRKLPAFEDDFDMDAGAHGNGSSQVHERPRVQDDEADEDQGNASQGSDDDDDIYN